MKYKLIENGKALHTDKELYDNIYYPFTEKDLVRYEKGKYKLGCNIYKHSKIYYTLVKKGKPIGTLTSPLHNSRRGNGEITVTAKIDKFNYV